VTANSQAKKTTQVTNPKFELGVLISTLV